jgi:hypothetical protein
MNTNERAPITANIKNVDEMPNAATTEGKNRPTKKFVIHRIKTERPMSRCAVGFAGTGS